MTHEFLFVLWSAARAHEREIADAAVISRFIEESVELFGYALMFAWAAPHALCVCSPRREPPPTCG